MDKWTSMDRISVQIRKDIETSTKVLVSMRTKFQGSYSSHSFAELACFLCPVLYGLEHLLTSSITCQGTSKTLYTTQAVLCGHLCYWLHICGGSLVQLTPTTAYKLTEQADCQEKENCHSDCCWAEEKVTLIVCTSRLKS